MFWLFIWRRQCLLHFHIFYIYFKPSSPPASPSDKSNESPMKSVSSSLHRGLSVGSPGGWVPTPEWVGLIGLLTRTCMYTKQTVWWFYIWSVSLCVILSDFSGVAIVAFTIEFCLMSGFTCYLCVVMQRFGFLNHPRFKAGSRNYLCRQSWGCCRSWCLRLKRSVLISKGFIY